MTIAESPWGYRADRVLRARGESRVTLERRRLALLWEAACGYDVIHFNFGRSLAPARPFGLLDVPLLRRLGRGVVVTFQGDDVRRGDVARAVYRESLAHELPHAYTPATDARRRRTVRVFARNAHRIFFLNPDLAHVLPPRAEFLPYASVDLDEWRPVRAPANDPPLVVHAPSDPDAKGTRQLEAAVARLRGEGVRLELRLVTGLARHEARRLYEHADVFVDQLLAGWYGGVAVEAMALGRPVVAYIRDDDLALAPAGLRDELPIVRASRDDVADVLRRLVQASPEERAAIGRRSRAFVERWHDPVAIARRLRGVYESIAAS